MAARCRPSGPGALGPPPPCRRSRACASSGLAWPCPSSCCSDRRCLCSWAFDRGVCPWWSSPGRPHLRYLTLGPCHHCHHHPSHPTSSTSNRTGWRTHRPILDLTSLACCFFCYLIFSSSSYSWKAWTEETGSRCPRPDHSQNSSPSLNFDLLRNRHHPWSSGHHPGPGHPWLWVPSPSRGRARALRWLVHPIFPCRLLSCSCSRTCHFLSFTSL